MKRFFILGVFLSLLFNSCSVPPQATATSTAFATPMPTSIVATTAAPELFETPWEDRSIFKSGLVASAQPILSEMPNASVYHLTFDIADDLYHVTGTEEVRYTNAEEAALEEVQLRLFPNILGGEMVTSNLMIDGQSVTSRLEAQNSLLVVQLSAPLEPGQSAIVQMDFEVTVPLSVELNYGVLSYFEDVLTLSHAYPMIAVYDDEGWNAEIPQEYGDITYADTSFFLVKVTAPKDVILVTSGRNIGLSQSGERQTVEIASGPTRDFYLAASPNYEEISRTFGEVTIRSYAPAESKAGAQMAVDVAARAIEDFSVRYAPFPYTEFDIVSTPTLALGIEYPGIIAITSRIYDLHQDVRGTPAGVYLESTVAHEVGHQWFYSLIGDDQLDDPWLDESLTQFATLQYYADEYGPSGEQGFRNSLEGSWDSVDRADIPIGLPVDGYSGQEYRAIVYGRGPLFFVTLRERMGTDIFDAFIKEYTETLSWGIATPEFLQSLAEKHCACDLDALFNEWVYP